MLAMSQVLRKCFIYITLFHLPRKARIPTLELTLLILFLALTKRKQSGGGCNNLIGKGKGLNYGGDGRNAKEEMGSSYIQAIKIGKSWPLISCSG